MRWHAGVAILRRLRRGCQQSQGVKVAAFERAGTTSREQQAASSQVCERRALLLDVHVCCVLAFSRPEATACSHCNADRLFCGSANACVNHSSNVRIAATMSRALLEHACCMLFRLLVCTLCHWHAATFCLTDTVRRVHT